MTTLGCSACWSALNSRHTPIGSPSSTFRRKICSGSLARLRKLTTARRSGPNHRQNFIGVGGCLLERNVGAAARILGQQHLPEGALPELSQHPKVFHPWRDKRGSGGRRTEADRLARLASGFLPASPLDADWNFNDYAKGAACKRQIPPAFFAMGISDHRRWTRGGPRKKRIRIRSQGSCGSRASPSHHLVEMMRLPLLLGALSLGMALPAASFSPSGAAVTNGLRPAVAGPGATAFRRAALRPRTCNNLPTAFGGGGGGGYAPCMIPRHAAGMLGVVFRMDPGRESTSHPLTLWAVTLVVALSQSPQQGSILRPLHSPVPLAPTITPAHTLGPSLRSLLPTQPVALPPGAASGSAAAGVAAGAVTTTATRAASWGTGPSTWSFWRRSPS